jgi:hypothetical protein
MGLPITGKLLGQTQPQTTARYAHLDADPLRKAANTICATIAAAMGEQFEPLGNVAAAAWLAYDSSEAHAVGGDQAQRCA